MSPYSSRSFCRLVDQILVYWSLYYIKTLPPKTCKYADWLWEEFRKRQQDYSQSTRSLCSYWSHVCVERGVNQRQKGTHPFWHKHVYRPRTIIRPTLSATRFRAYSISVYLPGSLVHPVSILLVSCVNRNKILRTSHIYLQMHIYIFHIHHHCLSIRKWGGTTTIILPPYPADQA